VEPEVVGVVPWLACIAPVPDVAGGEAALPAGVVSIGIDVGAAAVPAVTGAKRGATAKIAVPVGGGGAPASGAVAPGVEGRRGGRAARHVSTMGERWWGSSGDLCEFTLALERAI